MHKIKTHHKHKEGKILAWITLMIQFNFGLTLPIFPNFVKTIVGSDFNVSIFFAAMAITIFFGALISTTIFKKIERTLITKASLLILSISSFFLVFTTRVHALALLSSIQMVLGLFLVMVLALFVRDFAKAKNLGAEEGRHYKYFNIGLLLGPLVGGFTASTFGYESTFMISSLCFLLTFIFFNHLHLIYKHPAIIEAKLEIKGNTLTNVKAFFGDIDRAKAYMIATTLMLWVGVKRIYIPLYIAFAGYLESLTGLMLAVSIIPFILLESKVGEYADKHGIHKPLATGFFIMAACLIFAGLSPFHFLNLIILIVVSFGAALVEPLQEYYLFKHLKKEEEDNLYGIYMTADPISYFLAPSIGALIILFLPFQYIFLTFGILILSMGAFSLVKVRS